MSIADDNGDVESEVSGVEKEIKQAIEVLKQLSSLANRLNFGEGQKKEIEEALNDLQEIGKDFEEEKELIASAEDYAALKKKKQARTSTTLKRDLREQKEDLQEAEQDIEYLEQNILDNENLSESEKKEVLEYLNLSSNILKDASNLAQYLQEIVTGKKTF